MTEPVRWTAAFLAMVEALGGGARLQRGRRDARAGHVRALTISTSVVVAQVRAPDQPSYRTRIAVRAFGAAEWGRIEAALAAEARYAAELLAGRMPAEVDGVLAGLGLRLLPDGIDEVAMDCTCQGWAMPCEHLTATWYALARSLETDPFGALAWRGRGRDELLDRLRLLRAGSPPGGAAPAAGTAPDPVDGAAGGGAGGGAGGDPAALESFDDPARFWTPRGTATPPARRLDVPGTVRRPDALLDELDPLPLTWGGRSVTDLLRPAYRALAAPADPD